MGYDIKIGQRKKYYDLDEDFDFEDVPSVKLDAAPAFGEPTDHMNERWPSHTGWEEFLKFTGLTDLFYNESTGLFKEEVSVITQDQMIVIDEAYAAFLLSFPNAIAGFSPKDGPSSVDPLWPIENRHLARLTWLKFWFDWALKNCTDPVITH